MSRLAGIGLKCDGNQYDDMICMEHPTSRTHPRMSAVDRAAQFAPFAALSGFEEAIRQAQEKNKGGQDMITMLNRKGVYIGHDMKQFSEIRNLLAEEGIDYKYKVKNQMGEWSGEHGTIRSNMGMLGQDSSLDYEYEIFVHKDDYERAGSLVENLK